MQSTDNLAARAVEDPKMFASLSHKEAKAAFAKLVIAVGFAFEKCLEGIESEVVANQKPLGDKLLDTKEIAERLGCCVATVVRGWKDGRYPFMFKNGGRLMGSESGLERWIAARVKRQPLR